MSWYNAKPIDEQCKNKETVSWNSWWLLCFFGHFKANIAYKSRFGGSVAFQLARFDDGKLLTSSGEAMIVTKLCGGATGIVGMAGQ